MGPPRVFIARHGETEWSLNGRHTSVTDLPLTAKGERSIIATGNALVGPDRVILPENLAHIYVSPRLRARRTLELLGINCRDKFPWKPEREYGDDEVKTEAKVEVTEDIREWDYGVYEGVTSKTINQDRKNQGLPPWDIWTDGCPGGESPRNVSERLDRLIEDIREKYHKPALASPNDSKCPGDVLVVGHGHILRAFVFRWINKAMSDDLPLLLQVGGVGILSYVHDSIDEPAIHIGPYFNV